MEEIDIAKNTQKIVSIVVSTHEAKNYPNFLIIFPQKNHLWNKLKVYRKAPILTRVFSGTT